MDNKKKGIGIFIAAIMVISVLAFAMPVVAKDPPHVPVGSATIAIDNGIINIDVFGETCSGLDVWLYRGGSNAFYEEPLMSYGTNLPVYLSDGTVHQFYPATGNPDVWYDAIVGLDLDGDASDDINVTRSIMVPSGQKYFVVKYCIENINGSDLTNFRFFQGVDYDAGDAGTDDEGGYAYDFVWTHDLDDGFGTYVGFTGDRTSDHHSVDEYTEMWNDLEAGSLNDANYYNTDVGVGLEWDLGNLHDGETECLNVTFFFRDQEPAQAPILTPIGLIALVGLLSVIAAMNIKIRKRRG